MAMYAQNHWPPLDLNCNRKQQCHGALQLRSPDVLQPEPAVGDESLSGYRLFDIRPLVKFVEQFPYPTCQQSGYGVTEFRAGLATTVLFYMQGMWCYHELEKHL